MISLKKFIIYLLIALVPFISMMFYSYIWNQWEVSKIAVEYPKILNVIEFFDLKNTPKLIKSEMNNFNSKIFEISNEINKYRNYFNDVLRSKYFLQILFNELDETFKKYRTNFFVENIEITSKSFFVKFYEFSRNQYMDLENLRKKLSAVYKDFKIELVSTKNLYKDFKVYEYVLEGSL